MDTGEAEEENEVQLNRTKRRRLNGAAGAAPRRANSYEYTTENTTDRDDPDQRHPRVDGPTLASDEYESQEEYDDDGVTTYKFTVKKCNAVQKTFLNGSEARIRQVLEGKSSLNASWLQYKARRQTIINSMLV